MGRRDRALVAEKWPVYALVATILGLPNLSMVGLRTVDAYINGGDFRNDLQQQQAAVERDGWHAAFALPLPLDARYRASLERDPPGRAERGGRPAETSGVNVPPRLDDETAFLQWVRQLVSRAVRELPDEGMHLVSRAERDQLVEFARPHLARGLREAGGEPAKTRVGSLEVQAGVLEIHTWWETKYGRGLKPGQVEIHAKKKAGLCPFVALRVSNTESRR